MRRLTDGGSPRAGETFHGSSTTPCECQHYLHLAQGLTISPLPSEGGRGPRGTCRAFVGGGSADGSFTSRIVRLLSEPSKLMV